MTSKLALIHTSQVLVPMFNELCKELLPDVEVIHFADDSLIKETIAHGCPTAAVAERLNGTIDQAQTDKADVIMVTCSSVGAIVDAAAETCKVPLRRVDRAMVEHALNIGSRIGVIATVSTTLRPTAELVERCARGAGKQITVTTVLCDGALEKLLAGEVAQHDQMVMSKLTGLMSNVDVVLLAQASMARVIQQLPADTCKVPVLSSPRLAIESLVELFGNHRASAS